MLASAFVFEIKRSLARVALVDTGLAPMNSYVHERVDRMKHALMSAYLALAECRIGFAFHWVKYSYVNGLDGRTWG